MSLHVVVTVNQKGGVGKSTLNLNLAPALAALQLRVLSIDADPQGTSTEGFLGADPQAFGLAEVLARTCETADAIVRTASHGCDLLPARYSALRAQINELRTNPADGMSAFLRLLEPVEDRYDIVLVDCAPDLDILTSAALVAANEVIIPTQPAREAAHGLGYLFGRIQSTRTFNQDLAHIGLTITNFQAHLKFDQEFKEMYDSDKRFDYVATIRSTSGFKKAFDLAKPLSAIAESKATRAAVAEIIGIAQTIADHAKAEPAEAVKA